MRFKSPFRYLTSSLLLFSVLINHLELPTVSLEKENSGILSSSRNLTEQFNGFVYSTLKMALDGQKAISQLGRKLILEKKYINFSIRSAEGRQQVTSCAIQECPEFNPLLEIASSFLTLERTKFSPLQIKEAKNVIKQISCGTKKKIICKDSKYRRLDGKCNNLMDSDEGSASSCHLRFISSSYEDGIKEIRKKSINGKLLPEPRHISLALTRNICKSSTNISNIFQSFGQFIAHDMSLTPQTSLNGKSLQCCPIGSNKHPECSPIKINSRDPDFSFRCLNFVRSQPCSSCSGVREQINLNTPTLDCSHVYGINRKQSSKLRTNNGKMIVRSFRKGEFPPPSKNPKTDQCSQPKKRIICPLTGDKRSNENPLLLSFHIIFLRLHNLIADKLKKLNAHWNNNKLFQETRRLVIAIYQHIVYCEYLPTLFGFEISKKNHICENKSFYNINARLGTWNEWAAAIFRIGHPTVPEYLKMISDKGATTRIPLRKLFFNSLYVKNNLDNLIRGATMQNQITFDQCMSRSVTKFLYTTNEASPSMDLASLNIKRGRDHGIPSYIRYFRLANPNKPVINFKDIMKTGLLYENSVKQISEIYSSLQDVDLFVGLMCEKPIPGAIIGPTAVHFNMMQFQNIRAKDRYFYTTEGQTGSFTKEQINAIMNITLSTIVCLCTNLTEVASEMMITNSPVLSCKQIPKLYLEAWKEE